MKKTSFNTFNIGIPWNYEYRDRDTGYHVPAYYNKFKDEILNYNHVSHDKYNKIINNPITCDALICIIMHCDYTELSRDFTLSFRKRSEFELMAQIKKRNSKYYHWSKILQHTIKHFGQSELSDNGLLSFLRGPLFCGMSIILAIPQFNMYFYSPTLTSIHLEVALKFSGEEGMILEMDNSKR